MTLSTLFNHTGKGNITIILENYNLKNVGVDSFQEVFGAMTKEEIKQFILDPKNAFELSKYGHRLQRSTFLRSYSKLNADGYPYGTPSDKYELNDYDCF